MIALKNRIDVNRPVSDVFDFVAHVENAPKWQPAVIETRRMTDGPIRVGTKFSEVAKMMGRRVETVCEITELVPDRKLSWRATSTGPFSYQTSYAFTSHGQATRIDIVGTFALRGLWRLLEPFVGGEVRKESAQELTAMKAAIEAR